MRLPSVTLLLLWASIALAADPPAPATPAAATPANPGTTAPATPGTTAPAGEPGATTTPTASAPAAPVKEPEAELARALAKQNTVGRVVELPVAGRTVLALYTPQTAPRARGALLLLHDLGGHADWPGAIAALRRDLPALGWSTLSVQLPVAEIAPPATQRKAWLDQITPRIDAALAYLKGEGQLNVVLAGHGLGAVAALDYATNHEGMVRGIVLLSLPLLRGDDPRLATGDALGRTRLPILDLYGTADVAEIAATASRRREGAGHGGNYLQVVAPGADHFFTGQGPLVTTRVRGWLDRHVAGVERRRPDEEKGREPVIENSNKGNQP